LLEHLTHCMLHDFPHHLDTYRGRRKLSHKFDQSKWGTLPNTAISHGLLLLRNTHTMQRIHNQRLHLSTASFAAKAALSLRPFPPSYRACQFYITRRRPVRLPYPRPEMRRGRRKPPPTRSPPVTKRGVVFRGPAAGTFSTSPRFDVRPVSTSSLTLNLLGVGDRVDIGDHLSWVH